MSDAMLQVMVMEFNKRRYAQASKAAAEGLAVAQGRDEAFWQGLCDACDGYTNLMSGQLNEAEHALVNAMQKLRNFGFRHQNFEVTAALAGIRTAVAEIRAVRKHRKRVFDLSLLPQLRMAAKADD